jgi:hypothetical protein
MNRASTWGIVDVEGLERVEYKEWHVIHFVWDVSSRAKLGSSLSFDPDPKRLLDDFAFGKPQFLSELFQLQDQLSREVGFNHFFAQAGTTRARPLAAS